MTDDLITFLRARLDEREARARAATQGQHGRWMTFEGKHYDDGRARQAVTVFEDADGPWPGEDVLTNCSYDHSVEEQEEADLLFIVDNDPAIVLDDVVAKRHLLNWLSGELAVDYGGAEAVGEHMRATFTAALKVLALPYVDHPDYREEWKP
jgi:hypothetical protein